MTQAHGYITLVHVIRLNDSFHIWLREKGTATEPGKSSYSLAWHLFSFIYLPLKYILHVHVYACVKSYSRHYNITYPGNFCTDSQ
jgi:hypothetical protein